MNYLHPSEPKLTRRLLKVLSYFQPGQIVDKLNRKAYLPAVKRVARFIELNRRARELTESFSLFFDSPAEMGKFLSALPKGAHSYRSMPAAVSEIPNRRQWGNRIRYSFDPSIFPALHAHNERLNRVMTELDKAAARYNWHPSIWSSGYGDSTFLMGTGWKARSADEHWENYAIWFFCSQRNGELLDYFRRCQECDKWFFAATGHQVYCRDSCRKRSSSHSEHFKNARREYMREYRSQEKMRDAAAKKLAARR